MNVSLAPKVNARPPGGGRPIDSRKNNIGLHNIKEQGKIAAVQAEALEEQLLLQEEQQVQDDAFVNAKPTTLKSKVETAAAAWGAVANKDEKSSGDTQPKSKVDELKDLGKSFFAGIFNSEKPKASKTDRTTGQTLANTSGLNTKDSKNSAQYMVSQFRNFNSKVTDNLQKKMQSASRFAFNSSGKVSQFIEAARTRQMVVA
jgi:hypothetical protein